MSSIGRLLVAVLCLCSLPAFSQDHQAIGSPTAGTIPTTQVPDFRTTPSPSEPWKIFPSAPGQDKTTSFLVAPDEAGLLTPDADKVCYAIRSYVVARDSKDSDSVHPVSYSTCQPASRYRLKNTVIQQDVPGR